MVLSALSPYIGEIRAFTYGFVPRNWLLCDGAMLAIYQYVSLYEVIGQKYGGEGETKFALPNLKGRAPIGTGLMTNLGQYLGSSSTTLNSDDLPRHNHSMYATDAEGTEENPSDNSLAGSIGSGNTHLYGATPNTQFASTTIGTAGASTPTTFNNMQPFNTVVYCICYEGDFPSPD